MAEIEEINPWNAITELDPNTTEFTANGKTYFVNMDISRLTTSYYEQYESFTTQVFYAMTPDEIFKSITKAQDLIFSGKAKDAFIDLENIKRAVAANSPRRLKIALWMCTLFVLPDGHDISKTWHPREAEKSIQDWQAEGIGVGFFLTLALSLVKSFKEHFLSISKEYSEMSEMSQKLLEAADALETIYPES